jgi:putative transposase
MVLVTKYRKPVLINNVKDTVYNTIETIFKEKGINLISINGEPDHLHVLFEAGPEIQLLNLINIIKTKTARFARRDCSEILNQYYYKPYFWTDSYFVSTVGTNKKIIDEYINNQ